MTKYLIAVFLFCNLGLKSQVSEYKGVVLVKEGDTYEPLIGAQIRMPGKFEMKSIVTTDIEGRFMIEIPDDIPPIIFLNFGGCSDGEQSCILQRSIGNKLFIILKRKVRKRNLRKHQKIWINAGLDPKEFY